MKLFEDSIKERLFKNEDQKKLHNYSRCVEFIKDLFDMKLTNGDLEYLVKNLDTCNAQNLAPFIRDASIKYGVAIDSDYDLGRIFENIPTALEFYKTAEERNSAMLANTIKQMDEEGQSVAALITGGYHTKGLTELLKNRDTSYLVILPKFDASKGERPYVAILTSRHHRISAKGTSISRPLWHIWKRSSSWP